MGKLIQSCWIFSNNNWYYKFCTCYDMLYIKQKKQLIFHIVHYIALISNLLWIYYSVSKISKNRFSSSIYGRFIFFYLSFILQTKVFH